MCLFEVRVANNGSVKARGLGRQHQSEMAGDGRRRQETAGQGGRKQEGSKVWNRD